MPRIPPPIPIDSAVPFLPLAPPAPAMALAYHRTCQSGSRAASSPSQHRATKPDPVIGQVPSPASSIASNPILSSVIALDALAYRRRIDAPSELPPQTSAANEAACEPTDTARAAEDQRGSGSRSRKKSVMREATGRTVKQNTLELGCTDRRKTRELPRIRPSSLTSVEPKILVAPWCDHLGGHIVRSVYR